MSDDFDDDLDGSDLLKDLRKQLSQKDKELKEFKANFETLAKRDRERTLADTFKAKNVSEKVAKFYPSDRDASEDNIAAWLTENADVFGIKLDAPPAGEADAPPVPAGVQRMQALDSPSVLETGEAALLHQINQATSADDLTRLIQSMGGGSV